VKRRSFDESDRIRLNLERLDIQTRQRTAAEYLFSEAPLMPYAVAFIIGILFADAACRHNRLFWLTAAGALLTAALCFILSFRTPASGRLGLLLFCSCLTVFSLAALRCCSILAIGPNHILHYLGSSQRELATLQGKVISPVIVNAPTADSSIPWLESKSSFYIKTSRLRSSSGWQTVSGIIRVQVNEPIRHVRPGNTVQVYCWLSRFGPPANPGQFDLRRYMHRKGVYLAASVDIREGIEVLDSSSSYLTQVRSVLYRIAANALLDETITTDEDAASLASALLLGERGGLHPQLLAAFGNTNLAHYISLSGLHIGILAGSLWGLLRTAGLPRRSRAVLCIFLILIYALIVPPRAPTLRAVILSCFFFISVLAARRPSGLNTLALSAVILLYIRPYDLFNAGWQLSFLSVLGILLFYKPVQFYLLNWFFYSFLPYLRFFGMQHFLHSLLEMLAVGISAWLAIAGLLLFYFGKINPLSPLWTVLLFPFVIVILYAGFLKILLSAVLPTAAALCGLILNLTTDGFEKTVIFLAQINLDQLAFRPSSLWAGFIYFLMAAFYLTPFRYSRSRKTLLGLLVISFLLPALWQKISVSRQNMLEIVCLSVGHGQAIVLSGPAGEHIIFDAGSITHQHLAASVIVPFLQQKGIAALDAAYLSHGDLDHINAAADLADWIGIRAVYANSILIESAQRPSVEKELKDRLEQMHKPLRPPAEYRSKKGMHIRSIWPTQEAVSNLSLSENDKSEVFLIEYAGRRILLCGDIEDYAQSELMRRDPPLQADVVILPHHGSTANLQTGFVEHFQPQVVVASCAANRLATIYRPLPSSGIKAFYTPADGAVTIQIKADGTLSAVGFSNGFN